MRYVLIALAIGVAPQASAQDAPNISGFRIGMSVEEARGIAPGLFRRDHASLSLFEVTQRSHSFGGVAFPLSLVFVNGALDYAGGGSTLYLPRVETCLERHQALVEALESTIGPLPDAEQESRANDLVPLRTAGGSYTRRYGSDTSMSAVATANTPISLDVRVRASRQRDGLWQCSTDYGMSAAVPIPSGLPESGIEGFSWLARPTGSDIVQHYPRRAMEVGRPGHVVLVCAVRENGSLSCHVGHENPLGWGFGEAALRLTELFRMAPQTMSGASTAGATITVPIRFQAND
jgi:TonB family protein